MTERTIGQIIEGLGVTADSLSDDALVTDAVVLLKYVNSDGEVALFLAHGEGMSWIERIGMLRAAEQLELPHRGWPSDD